MQSAPTAMPTMMGMTMPTAAPTTMTMMDDDMAMDDDGGMNGMNGGDGGMSSTFEQWSTYQLRLIFTTWNVQTPTEFVFTWFAVAVAAASVHGLRWLISATESSLQAKRSLLDGRSSQRALATQEVRLGGDSFSAVQPPAATSAANATGSAHSGNLGQRLRRGLKSLSLSTLLLLHSLLSALSYGLSLMLMLVAMSYNPSLFLALVVGYGLGDLAIYRHLLGAHGNSNSNNSSAGAQDDCL